MKNINMDTLNADFSHLESTCLYCSEESAEQIRTALSEVPLRCVHLLGTGDYHYLSLFTLEQIQEDFCLVLFDNHSDDQQTAFGGDLLSCGSWVLHARNLPHLKQDIWIQQESDISKLLDVDYPVYLSIDLDVLSREYARTDWDQGQMTIPALMTGIKMIGTDILGVDICGGIAEEQNPSADDQQINQSAYDVLTNYFSKL